MLNGFITGSIGGQPAPIVAEPEEKPEAGVVVKSLETLEGGLAGLGAGIAGKDMCILLPQIDSL